MINAEYLLREIAEAYVYKRDEGVFIWRSPPIKKPRLLGCVAGSRMNQGYFRIRVGGIEQLQHRMVWLVENGVMPSGEIDHINGNRRDNRIINLRDVPRYVNQQNRKCADVDSKTGVLGVSPNGRGFVARIKFGGRQMTLGTYSSVGEAHAVYLNAKRQMHLGNTL